MKKLKVFVNGVELKGLEKVEGVTVIDKSLIKGGRGDEEAIKKNRCSTRMTSEEALKIELENGSIIEAPELKGDVVRGKGRWLFPNEDGDE